MKSNQMAPLFDGFEHIGVYILDRATQVVYYENPLAEKYTGYCRLGEPCFRAHGNDVMCSSCPIRRADHLSFVHRADYNMVFAVRCEEVEWDGKDCYLIIVVKQEDSTRLTEDEKSINRMSRALEKSVNICTEINMETLHYRQMNLRGIEGYTADTEGDYPTAYERMCREEIHPDDVAEVRRTMAPEVLKRIAYESEGMQEISVRYRLKNVKPERTMESRAIFLRDEVPHYVVSVAQDVTEETQVRRRMSEYEDILNNVSCGVAIYNVTPDGTPTVQYLNEGLARMADCDKDALLQKSREDPAYGMDAESRRAFAEAFRHLAEGAKTAEHVLGMVSATGHRHWAHMTLNASRAENGALQACGTFYDVTADIRVQREFLEKYEIEKRRTKDDASLLAYGVFDLRDNRTVEMERRAPFNALAAPMAMEAFAADICTTIPDEESRARFAALFTAESLMAQHAQGVDEQTLEYRRRLPSGRIIWVRSSFRVIADLSDSATLLFYYCYDINGVKNLALMSNYMVDEDYEMLGSVNLKDDTAVMLYGKNSSRGSAAGGHLQVEEIYTDSLNWFIEHSVLPEEREAYRAQAQRTQIRETLAQKSHCEFILHVRDNAGRLRTKKIRYTRNSADPDGCFFSQVDITETLAEEEKKQQQLQAVLQSARQANEAKTNFLSRMSHDMRTPMNGVLGLANLMRDETDLDAIRKDLDQLELSGKYLLQLINDTLDVNKIEAGKLELRLKPINSEQLFGNIIANASMLAQDKGVELALDLPQIPHGGWVTVMADGSRLEQVVMNVVSNAIKFTPAGGTVQLKMESISIGAEEVVDRYTITDTGIGMSREFLAHVYEPFSQEGRANTERESGTGLGMSIVKQLVELMHGEISIESELGHGTKVTLLMRYPVCKQCPATAPKAEVAPEVLRGKRVLLCEDHPINAQIAERLLAKMGVSVTHAENGRQGVELFAACAPGDFAMILMDIRMPELNGLEATKEIRDLPRPDAKTIPIVAMTANAFEDDVQACRDAGMNDHIAKPIEPATMYETMARNL